MRDWPVFPITLGVPVQGDVQAFSSDHGTINLAFGGQELDPHATVIQATTDPGPTASEEYRPLLIGFGN